MGKVLGTVRRKAAAGAVGLALLAVGVGFGAHAATGPTQTRPVSDTAAVSTPAATTAAATTSQAPEPAPTTATVASTPTADTQAATVQVVEPAPAPAVEPAPATDTTAADTTTSQLPADAPTGSSVGVDGRTYGPMPSPTMEKLPGEDGYIPPGQTAPVSPPAP